MNQADIEKYAFLYFCGEKDRDILLENRKMTFEDLERFSYLTDLFGFQKYRARSGTNFPGSLKKNSRRWNIYMKKVQILFETIIFHKIRKI